MTVTLYTKPNCPACTMTKRHLDKRGVGYDELPIDDGVLLRADAAGIASAPIVEAVGFAPWGGYRPDRIDALVMTAA